MSVEQVVFDIPDVIQKGIDNGKLIRYGGVVRDQAGHIVKHLKEVSLPKADRNTNPNNIMAFAKKNKHLLIGTVIVTTVVGVTYVIRKKKNKEVKIPKCVVDFNDSFMVYVDSIKKSTVSEEKIDRVITALEDMKKNQENGNINLVFSIENINLLLEMVRNYTLKFAEANSVEVIEDSIDKENKISSLQHYLKIQKRIFERCA